MEHKIQIQSFLKWFKNCKGSEKQVLPERKAQAGKEKERNKTALRKNSGALVNWHHRNFLNTWWKLSWHREDLISKIKKIKRYCVCSRVTQRNIFEFVSSSINPNDALMVFAFEDDYSFGVLQSSMHYTWLKRRCSTLGTGLRYTANTVYDTFAWPQNPTLAQVLKVAEKSRELRKERTNILKRENITYRDLYRSLELPGNHKMLKYHKALDLAVHAAYGLKKGQDELSFLLKLNFLVAKKETKGERVTAPGLPHIVKNAKSFISNDYITL